MGMKLFDESEDDTQDEDVSKIEINKEFARRYEHNKRREDLHRYEELKKKGQIEESSSDSKTESSDDELDSYVTNPSKKQDKEFIDNLIKVKNRDPVLYQKVDLFKSDDEKDSDSNSSRDDNEVNEKHNKDRKQKKKKSVYLKDVVAQQLIEEGPEFEEVDHVKRSKGKDLTYNEEQEELKKAFFYAANGDEEDEMGEGDFLKVKEKGEKDEEGEDDDGEYEKRLNEYFGKEGQLDENGKFLKEFFLKRMWLDNGSKENKSFEDDDMDALLMDEEEVDRQEEYEEKYNFRYQENAGDRVAGHSRIVEGSVRNKESARKLQRKSKEERMKIAEMERKEELKHLKNMKKKEMKERMKKVMEAAGIKDDDDCPLDLDDLEDEFDPEEFDKMMKKAFSEKYYEAEDANPDFGSDYDGDGGDFTKPDFDKEDELLGLPKGWDDAASGDGFLAVRERILKCEAENGSGDNHGEEEEEEDADGPAEEAKEEAKMEGKRKRKRKMSLVKKVKEEMLEEYYKLDYEDTIEDLKTRFKYTKVNPNRYGLKPEEILWSNDQDLNQYVSIKKIAPYKEKEWKVPHSKRHPYKTKLKQMLQQKPDGSKNHKKNRSKDNGNKSAAVPGSSQEGKVELAGPNGDMGNLSRKAKRRKRNAELKLDQSRRAAYGMT